MASYVGNIEDATLQNHFFHQVLFTSKHVQLVVMCLKPGEEIGLEVHDSVDQFFRFEKGQGKVIINGEESLVTDGFSVIIPAGAQHNVINTSTTDDLKLYTLYSPPNHPDGTTHKTKAEAEEAEKLEH
jgi:mannose-6-phosphate isomerase-like protein (cupin superfamily)